MAVAEHHDIEHGHAADGDGGHHHGHLTLEYQPGLPMPNSKLIVWLFLSTEIMFFAGLIGTYIVLRFGAPAWPKTHDVHLSEPIGAFNTFVLICSSVTVVLALKRPGTNKAGAAKGWLLVDVDAGLRVPRCEDVSNTAPSLPTAFIRQCRIAGFTNGRHLLRIGRPRAAERAGGPERTEPAQDAAARSAKCRQRKKRNKMAAGLAEIDKINKVVQNPTAGPVDCWPSTCQKIYPLEDEPSLPAPPPSSPRGSTTCSPGSNCRW